LSARRVLVTGASGLIGRAFLRHVGGKYAVRALNRRAVPGVETVQADLADAAAIQPAFSGIDTVVHLAAAAGDQHPADVLMRSNVVGTLNVFEAARTAGCTRVIFASSGAVTAGWEREPPLSHLVAGRYDEAGVVTPLTHETPLRPGGLYGVTKVWGEALARQYSDAHGLSAICLRIGRVKDEDKPTVTRDFAVWCSQRDIVRMLEACVEAPASVRFDIFYVVSNLAHGYRDVEHAKRVLGWSPLDRA